MIDDDCRQGKTYGPCNVIEAKPVQIHCLGPAVPL